jgi:hypothetical protein
MIFKVLFPSTCSLIMMYIKGDMEGEYHYEGVLDDKE